MITKLIERELLKREGDLAAACVAANRDRELQREIDEWQSFEDGATE